MKQLVGAGTFAVLALIVVVLAGTASATTSGGAPSATGQVPISFLHDKHAGFASVGPRGGLNGQGHARHGIANIDSLPNWNDHFFTPGFDSNGNPQQEWFTNTVGNPPNTHGTTTLASPLVPVTVRLLDAAGNVATVGGQPLVSSPAPYVAPTLASPVFQDATYSSSPVPTQFTDAVQRAEYWSKAKPDWHTLLAPSVKTGRTIDVPFGKYFFALNADGTCCAFILVDIDTFANLLFPTVATDTTTPVGAAENAGDITTKDMSTFLFPNTYLFFNGDPTQCCVLGFHTYDFEPGDASNGNNERRYVLNYSSWISPGLFGGDVGDVTALSHEIAETYNDPFVTSDGIHDVTPWWLAPNGLCQNSLETGDVIEGLPDDTFPMTMNGMTYHPQNEALLQYFQFQQPSSAIDGAYSYPNESVLTGPSTLQHAGCK